MLFWNFGFPVDPNSARVNFDPINDVPGAGFNGFSYNNAEFNRLMDEANAIPGCDQAARAELYKKAFRILRDDVPWVWLDTTIVVVAAQPGIVNWDPRPGPGYRWNQDAWIIPR